jgi:hypothetical protein
MTLATFAFLIAFWEWLIGVPLLVAPQATSAWMLRLVKDDVLYRIVGGAFLMLCVLPLFGGAAITADVAGLVRLLAWWGVIKCLVICWFPDRLAGFAQRMFAHTSLQRFFGVLAIAAGGLIFWAGVVLQGQG